MTREHRHEELGVERLEAFSDSVLAVVITLTAFELRAPAHPTLAAMGHVAPTLLVDAANFLFLGIYWNNHHHLLRAASRISAAIMWSNLALLFTLSLIPVMTQWVGTQYDATAPAVTYGVVALAAATCYQLLTRAIIRAEDHPHVARVVGRGIKGTLSLLGYVAGIGLALVSPWLGYTAYVSVMVLWLVPDRRFARAAH